MNASELNVTLPWDNSIWEADTPEEWLYLTRTSPPSHRYLAILKMYTDPGASPPPTYINALSRVLILYGLMSITWDMKRRDQTSLSSTTGTLPTRRWQSSISACYDKWKTDFDAYTKLVLSSLYSTHHSRFQRFAIANSAVYHIAQLILEVEIADLQIYSGAKHMLGRAVTDLDRQRSRTRIKEWIHRDGKSAGRAVCHAARLFRDGVLKLENWNVDDMIHYPWCLYLATLMCWTFHSTVVENSADDLQPSLMSITELGCESDEDGDWDAKTEMNALISAMTRLGFTSDTFARDTWVVAGKHSAAGLITCMVKQLNTVRWAVVRDGMTVLKNLLNKVQQ